MLTPDNSRSRPNFATPLPAALTPPDSHGLVLSRSGIVLVAYRDRFDWQVSHEHWRAVVTYLVKSDRSDLEEFADVTVAGHELMADHHAVDHWLVRASGCAR